MAKKPQPDPPDQSFSNTERLYRRVRRNNVGRDGKATFLAFALPDTSVNREKHARRRRRGKATTRRTGATFADFRVTIEDVLGRIQTTHADKLATLMTLNFQEFEDVSLLAA